MRRRATLFVVATVLAVASNSKPGRADDANNAAVADVLFEQGKKLMTEGNFAEACPKLAESNRLDSGVGTMLYLADCYEKSGKTASAWATFKEAILFAQKRSDSREQLARTRAAALEPRVPKLTLVVPAASRLPDLTIQRDGSEVGTAQWGVEVPIDPGGHAIIAKAPGRARWEHRFNVSANSAPTKIEVPILAQDTSASADRKPQVDTGSEGSGQRAVGIVLGIAGLAGIGVGTYFGLGAKSKSDEAKSFCDSTTCSDQRGIDLIEEGRQRALISTISFIAGGVVLLGGAVLYLTAPRGRAQAVGLSFDGLRLRF